MVVITKRMSIFSQSMQSNAFVLFVVCEENPQTIDADRGRETEKCSRTFTRR